MKANQRTAKLVLGKSQNKASVTTDYTHYTRRGRADGSVPPAPKDNNLEPETTKHPGIARILATFWHACYR